MKNTPLTRRSFLGGMTKSILAASIAPQFLPSRLFGEEAPSRTIQLGMIGVGNQGSGLLTNFLAAKGGRVAGICDPFGSRRQRAVERVAEANGEPPKAYNDFRELLAEPSIDAVVVATPDHWHAAIGMAAVHAGKDIYLEKPLGLSLDQNRAMQQACAATGRIFQYGTMQRAQGNLRQVVEVVRNGLIGKVERVDVWCGGGASGGGDPKEIPVPEGLDYELYIGPAPMRPCTPSRITNGGSWFISDYSIGFIAGWGAHPLDIMIWGIDSDLAGPATYSGTGKFPTSRLFDTCYEWDVNIGFADGVKAHFMSENLAMPVVTEYLHQPFENGTTFFGTEGWVCGSRNGVDASDPRLLRLKPRPAGKHVRYATNYYKGFLDSVRDRTPSLCTVDEAVRSDAMSHVSLMAIKSGQTVTWDPKACRIVSPEPLNRWMNIPTRGDWATV